MGAPKNTRAEIINKLIMRLIRLADPKIGARIRDLGGVPLPFSPVDLDHFAIEETEKWAKVIHKAAIKADERGTDIPTCR
jgi:hypothetical protein